MKHWYHKLPPKTLKCDNTVSIQNAIYINGINGILIFCFLVFSTNIVENILPIKHVRKSTLIKMEYGIKYDKSEQINISPYPIAFLNKK